MFKLKTRIQKIIAMSAAALTLNLAMILPAKAQTASEMLLALIAEYTYKTAEATYYIEQFSYSMLTILNSWILPDESDTTANLQASFVTVTNTALQNATAQNALQQQLTQEFLAGANIESIPYVNDFTYQTMLGQPYASPDPRKKEDENINPTFNYIKNAAGINIRHRIPNNNWKGSQREKENYRNFYTTVSSIQMYNAYLLSQLYTEAAGGNQLTQQQNVLMQQASNSNWFAEVASENIGFVLRQLLMYNSQTYVLLTQLLQTQKQSLSAQAMTNTLLVLGNQFTETQLLSKATGAQQ
jgi:hypothetical protein